MREIVRFGNHDYIKKYINSFRITVSIKDVKMIMNGIMFQLQYITDYIAALINNPETLTVVLMEANVL